ncbi:MAG: methyltransferase type 12 [Rickettsiales bacterium]|nr:methyltransferase type 12 [Rickettsiales bacterium]
MSTSTAPKVKAQYESYPYPPRKAEQEDKRLLTTAMDALDTISHYGFGGAFDPTGKRILIAGEGTGDSTIYLAEQLRDYDTEIVALDFSQTSQEISKARLKARGLSNVQSVHGSLLELDSMELGQFDYINCSGVLHHLEDPLAGLQQLKAALTDDGVIALLLYSTVGRMPVYNMQHAMRLVSAEDDSDAQRIAICRSILQDLPATNWLQGMRQSVTNEINYYGDAGLYDLFLHSQDRGYSVEDIYALLGDAQMEMIDFIGLQSNAAVLYAPEAFVPSQAEAMKNMSKQERYAIAEKAGCHIPLHIFYASKKAKTPAQSTNEHLIPIWASQKVGSNMGEQIIQAFEGKDEGTALSLTAQGQIGVQVTLAKRSYTTALLQAIDGERSLAEIIQHVCAEHKAEPDTVRTQLRELFFSLHMQHFLMLRSADSPRWPSTAELQARVSQS